MDGRLLHASHNLFIQAILTPLTIDTGKTKWVIDEFGFALAIAAVVVAIIVWGLRAQVERDPINLGAADAPFAGHIDPLDPHPA
jgi:hypothetical protein